MIDSLKKEAGGFGARIVAVSKTKPEEAILDLYNKGQRLFGENRVQELTQKYDSLPKDIEWHMIGSLQKNKVKYIAPFVDLIHSVDSTSLLERIDKEANKNNRKISVLLQLKISEEGTKAGMSIDEATTICESTASLPHIIIKGLMGMASFTHDQEIVQTEFKSLSKSFTHLKESYFQDDSNFSELSMGMSGDYKLALKEGATLLRIGSLLFGSRY